MIDVLDFKKYLSNENASNRIEDALDIAWSYSQIDGEHHKAWVIDQIVRALCGNEDKYKKWIEAYEAPIDDEGDYYKWDCGIAP